MEPPLEVSNVSARVSKVNPASDLSHCWRPLMPLVKSQKFCQVTCSSLVTSYALASFLYGPLTLLNISLIKSSLQLLSGNTVSHFATSISAIQVLICSCKTLGLYYFIAKLTIENFPGFFRILFQQIETIL